ncbi:MAG: GAF domain-containing protein [Candidatus Xenobiia bacterium LiM19]
MIGNRPEMLDVDRISKRYQYLINACTLINSTLDLDNLLETITRQAMEIMEAEASSILLVDSLGKELSFKVAIGDVAEQLKGVRLKVGDGIAGWVAKAGEPLLIPDVKSDERFLSEIDQKTGFETKTLLCVPLKTTKKIHGVLEVINKRDNTFFTEFDVDFLLAMANQAAIAIENALLYNQLKNEKNRIETILNSMSDGVIVVDENADITMMNPAASRIFDLNGKFGNPSKAPWQKLQFLLREVRELKNNALFDIVLMKPESIILSNNVTLLKTPEGERNGAVMVLRNITENKDKEVTRSEYLTLLTFKIFAPLEFLLREIDSLSRETDMETPLRGIYDIQKNIMTVKNFVQKLHYFSELEAGPLRLERSNYRLSDLIDEAVMLSREEYDEFKISAEIPDIETTVTVDGGRIIEALMLLIFFFTSTVSSEQELQLELKENDDSYQICISNPIPGKLMDKIEKICSSSHLIEDFCKLKGGGEGLELLEFAFVKHLLDAHGGDFIIKKKGDDHILTITLPKEKGE